MPSHSPIPFRFPVDAPGAPATDRLLALFERLLAAQAAQAQAQHELQEAQARPDAATCPEAQRRIRFWQDSCAQWEKSQATRSVLFQEAKADIDRAEDEGGRA